ncbi:MAG: glycosyltransferase 87 family protein [Ardenticatenia bacterium]|nr:glycosyltransferase 87 family protein [Ardenticatenia bacterium]
MRVRLLGWSVGLVAVVAVTAVLLYLLVFRRVPFGVDFFTFWTAARATFVEGISPYSPEVARRGQLGILGRLSRPGEDQLAFVYPPYSLILLWPVAFMPFMWARSIWFALHLWWLLGLIFVLGKDPPQMVVATLPFLYPVARNLILGQLSLSVMLVLLVAWVLLNSQRKTTMALGGAVMAWVTIKPQLTWLFIIVMLADALRRRMAVWAWGGFGAGLLGFAALGWWWVPGWPQMWLQQVATYSGYHNPTFQPVFVGLIGNVWSSAVAWILLGGGVVFFLLTAVRWWRGTCSRTALLVWAGVLTLAVHPTFAVADTVLVLLPLLTWWQEEQAGRVFRAVWALFLVVPWLIFAWFIREGEPLEVSVAVLVMLVGWGTWLLWGAGRHSIPGAETADT